MDSDNGNSLQDNKEWPTYCSCVPGWDTNNCCPTCHADAYEYGIEPCSIKLDGEELFVCCKCWSWYCELASAF